MAWKKYFSTQKLVNAFPLWADARIDEQSTAFQLFNSIGGRLDDLRRQIDEAAASFYCATSNIQDIDVVYKIRLPGTFEFEPLDNDDTELTFTTPTVSGLLSASEGYVEVSLAENNDIESFWYTRAPDRLTVDTIETGTLTDHLVASGFANQHLLPVISSGIVNHPNQLTVTMSGIDSAISVQDNGTAAMGLVFIEGTTRAGLEVVEDLIFLHDDTQTTRHEYATVSGIKSYGIAPDTASILVTSWRRGEASIGEDRYYRTPYELAETIEGFSMPLFWTLRDGEIVDFPTLELHKYDIDDPELRLDGWTDKSVWYRTELLNASGLHFNAKDIAIEPWTKSLWIVEDHSLLLYDEEVYFPSFKSLQGKNTDSPSVIVASEYAVASGMDVTLEYVWRRAVLQPVKYRAWVEKPDGTKYSLEAGSEVTYHSDSSSWNYMLSGEPRGRWIKNPDTFTLDQRGDYLYCLETYFSDESTYVDKRVISVVSQTPVREYFMPAYGITNNLVSVDIDSEGILWLFDENGNKYEIGRHYDTMLIDIDKKVMYFREYYEQVKVYSS